MKTTGPELRQVDRALARLEDALKRCRTQGVRYGLGLSSALESWMSKRSKWLK